ncbi:BA75_03108T0 [Komagataella pastoris]|uniref:BA75_03108T0 n=1 Tax=Komagataella pastoris TaxID=4922 RepID=A0A1B2JCG8_PICPA|nr:BA75_03108T0 [Komagataella pastoris]
MQSIHTNTESAPTVPPNNDSYRMSPNSKTPGDSDKEQAGENSNNSRSGIDPSHGNTGNNGAGAIVNQTVSDIDHAAFPRNDSLSQFFPRFSFDSNASNSLSMSFGGDGTPSFSYNSNSELPRGYSVVGPALNNVSFNKKGSTSKETKSKPSNNEVYALPYQGSDYFNRRPSDQLDPFIPSLQSSRSRQGSMLHRPRQMSILASNTGGESQSDFDSFLRKDGFKGMLVDQGDLLDNIGNFDGQYHRNSILPFPRLSVSAPSNQGLYGNQTPPFAPQTTGVQQNQNQNQYQNQNQLNYRGKPGPYIKTDPTKQEDEERRGQQDATQPKQEYTFNSKVASKEPSLSPSPAASYPSDDKKAHPQQNATGNINVNNSINHVQASKQFQYQQVPTAGQYYTQNPPLPSQNEQGQHISQVPQIPTHPLAPDHLQQQQQAQQQQQQQPQQQQAYGRQNYSMSQYQPKANMYYQQYPQQGFQYPNTPNTQIPMTPQNQHQNRSTKKAKTVQSQSAIASPRDLSPGSPPTSGNETVRPLVGATKIDQLMLVIQARNKGITKPIARAPDGSIIEDETVIPKVNDLVGGIEKPHSKGSKQHECPHCFKKFTQATHLEVHIRSHIGLKPYACEYCGKRFTQGGNLRTHLRLHTGEKPFECNTCHKKFSRKGNLQAHRLTHENFKPFVCKLDDCNKTFTQLGNLKAHQNRFHFESLNMLTTKLASLSASGEEDLQTAFNKLPQQERELLEYFSNLYKNLNRGIRGRGGGAHSPQQQLPQEEKQVDQQQNYYMT